MKHIFQIVLIFAAILLITGCESSPDMLTVPEQAEIAKLRTGQYTLIANTELATLKQDAEIGKAVGRYQIHREGFRTWRLDTATGQNCLLLTAEEDWKKPETAAQGCRN